jgi:hypothetical protein
MTAQQQNLGRVRQKIDGVVVEFLEQLLDDGFSDFRMDDLHAFVTKRGYDVAPDSPGRVLRALRRIGEVDYWIVRRSDSLYRLVHVRGRT